MGRAVIRGVGVLALALVWACGPKALPAEGAVAGAERAMLVELARQLSERAGDDVIDAEAAALARGLARGSADAEVRDAAVRLLASLRDRAAPFDAAGEDVVAPEDTGLLAAEADGGEGDSITEGTAAELRAVEAGADDHIADARSALRRADYLGAVEALEPLKGAPSWQRALPFWEEAVDGYVGEQRERAGAMFVAAKRLAASERVDALVEVRTLLAGLLVRFPENAYVEPLHENLARVEAALADARRQVAQ